MQARGSADRSTRKEAAHSLKFFDDVARLVHEIGRTMCVALDQGHAAVCVVTPATRDLLEQHLRDRGIDVDRMRRCGQYVHIDAAEALEAIAPEGESPDGCRFDATVGVVVDRLARTYPRVWMYGELAGLMWLRGNQVGAVQLDRMWTAFADTHPVCLCVAFPLEALSYPVVAEAIHKVVADQIRILAKDSPLALAVRQGPAAAVWRLERTTRSAFDRVTCTGCRVE